MVGTKVLGKGQFGEVRYGGVMIDGEICKAAIKKLRGKNCETSKPRICVKRKYSQLA